jgi:hypothetical protein
MIKAADRALLLAKTKPDAAAPAAQSTAQVPPAEPADEIVLQLFKLNLRTGVLAPVFAYKMVEGQVEAAEDKIAEVFSESPKAPKKIMGRPPVRLIVTRVDKKDPDFVGMGGDPLEVGEVIELPLLIKLLKVPGSKLNATGLQYYLRNGRACEHSGYTFRKFEHFLKDLDGPARKDHQALADAHVEWCKGSHETPFE